MTPARVLMLVKGLGRGGTEQLLVSGLAYLDPIRFQVEVAYVVPWKDALVPLVKARSVPVHCLGRGRSGHLLWPARLRELLRRGRFDIVHTHMPVPAVVARLSYHRRGPALVHTEHNMWPRYRRPTYWANALTYHRNAAVLAVSEGVAGSIRAPRVVRRLGMPPVEVLIHGIDSTTVRRGAAARSNARRLLGLTEDDVVVGTIGNFTAKKNQLALLDAIACLTTSHRNLRLVLVGSGRLESDLRSHAAAIGLNDHVIWTGSRDDVPDLLPGFDVFALSSRHEGLSIALIEAMAAGLPCVATAVGGIPEVLSDGKNGLLVPSDDVPALGRAIDRLLVDEDLRETLAAAAIIRSEDFRLQRAVARLNEVYDEVMVARCQR